MSTTINRPQELDIGTVVTELDGTTENYTYQAGDRDISECIQLDDSCDAVEVTISGHGSDGNSCVFSIYGYANNGPALRIFKTVTAILGTAIAGAGQLFADTISGTDYHTESVGVYDSGNNTVAKMVFDTQGLKYLYFELVSLSTMTAVKFRVREIGQK